MRSQPASGDPDWLLGLPGRWRLLVHVQPGAASTASCGEHDGRLKIRLAAPPVEGRANDALIAWLARRLQLPRSHVSIAAGTSARRKTVEVVADLGAAELVARLIDAEAAPRGRRTADGYQSKAPKAAR